MTGHEIRSTGECRDRKMSCMLQPDRPEMRRKHVTVQQEAPVARWDGWGRRGGRGWVGVDEKSVRVSWRVCGGFCVFGRRMWRCEPFPLRAATLDKHIWKRLSPVQLGSVRIASVLPGVPVCFPEDCKYKKLLYRCLPQK